MNVTKKEATELICPLKAIHTVQYDFQIQGGLPVIIPHCIADKCMMWEWDNKNKREEKDTGHCGLKSKQNNTYMQG